MVQSRKKVRVAEMIGALMEESYKFIPAKNV